MSRPHGSTLVLVACVKGKQPYACPAQDLYLSDWFSKAARYAKSLSPHWAILSAQHGLVLPEQVLLPYEMSLHQMDKAQRLAWGQRVLNQLDAWRMGASRCVVLAGRAYREPLLAGLEQRFERVEVPLQGLGIGEQKSWLKTHTP